MLRNSTVANSHTLFYAITRKKSDASAHASRVRRENAKRNSGQDVFQSEKFFDALAATHEMHGTVVDNHFAGARAAVVV